MPQSNLNSGANPSAKQSDGLVENITSTVSDLASQGAEFVQNTVGSLSETASGLASQGSEYVGNLSGNLSELTSRGSEMLENRLSSLEDGFNTIVREWDEEKSITAGAAGLAAIGLVLGSKVDKKWFALSALAGGLYAAHKYSNGAALPAIKKLAGDLGGGLGFGGGNTSSSQRGGGTRIHENSNLRPSDLGSLERNQGGSSNAGSRSQGGNSSNQASNSNQSGNRSNEGGNRNQGNGGNSNSNRTPM